MDKSTASKTDLSGARLLDFVSLLASDAPSPGGGGASALCGALAASLCSMVANLTVGRKKYIAVEADMRRILSDADRLQKRLLQLIDEDAAGFLPLASAYGIPKDDPKRAEIMECALFEACRAPLYMMRCCAEAVALLEELYQKGSRLLLSDVGVGAELAAAAMNAASMNIFINTSSMQDGNARHALEAEADEMLLSFVPRARRISRDVQEQIRGKE